MNKKKAMALPITLFTLATLMVVAFSVSRLAVLQEDRLTAMENGIIPFIDSSNNDLFTDEVDGVQFLDEIVSKLDLPTFETSSGGAITYSGDGQVEDDDFDSIVLDSNNIELNFPQNWSGESGETEYVINNLSITKNNATLYLYPGEYWIGSLTVENNISVNVSVTGVGTVKIFVNTLSIGNNSEFNYPGNPAELLIVTYNDLYLKNAKIAGGIYSQGDVKLDGSEIVGAIVGKTFSEGVEDIEAQVIYDSKVLQTLLDLDF